MFTRALGLPADPVDAAGRLIEALRADRHRDISLGRISMAGAGDRYFTFNAGAGLDAEVVRLIEVLRARGRTATPRLYVWTALRQFYTGSDRQNPALTVERDGQPGIGHLFFALISNATPWTYLGLAPGQPEPGGQFRHRPRPFRAAPHAHRGHAVRAAPDAYQPGRPASRQGCAQPARRALVHAQIGPANSGSG